MNLYIRASQFPSESTIVEALRTLDRTPPLSPTEMVGEDGWHRLEVRLQVLPSDNYEEDGEGRPVCVEASWRLWTGDSSYDTDHRGYWGSTSLPFLGDPEGDDLDADDLAHDLRSEALEAAAMGDDFIDDEED